MNPQLNIFKGQPRHEFRVDQVTRAFVERMRALVASGADSAIVAQEMRERCIPYHVVARVVSGR